MMADLMATNKTLLEQLAVLTQEVAHLRTSSAPPRNPAPHPDGDGGGNQSTRKRYNNTNYCWSHGYDITREHDSSSCRFPKDGHNTAATRTNNMGGCQYNKVRRAHSP
jgi:hypothetical protein